MKRENFVIIRVNLAERAAIKRVAKQLERSQSDALRFLVRQADRGATVAKGGTNEQTTAEC